MAGLRSVVNLTVLMALILAVIGDTSKRLHARHDHQGGHGGGGGYQSLCTNDPELYEFYPPCSTAAPATTSTKSSTASTTESTTEASLSISVGATTTASNLSALQRAHWCRLSNGTYLPLDYQYINTACSHCRCLQSRNIRCQLLQCMPTYCIDNSKPIRNDGQCCTQCAYNLETNTSCLYDGINFPHGSVVKSVEDKMTCWCQLGNIECRNYMSSLFGGADLFADGVAIYIIVVIVFIVICFGLLLCCSFTLWFYYYYKRNQDEFQQAYDLYLNSAGWQPIEDGEENTVDPKAEEKRLEAEKHECINSFDEAVPPPYAAYNGSYVSEEEQKQL